MLNEKHNGIEIKKKTQSLYYRYVRNFIVYLDVSSTRRNIFSENLQTNGPKYDLDVFSMFQLNDYLTWATSL